MDWPAFDLALRARRRPILRRFTEFLRVDTVSQQPERVRAGANWLAGAMQARDVNAQVLELPNDIALEPHGLALLEQLAQLPQVEAV